MTLTGPAVATNATHRAVDMFYSTSKQLRFVDTEAPPAQLPPGAQRQAVLAVGTHPATDYQMIFFKGQDITALTKGAPEYDGREVEAVVGQVNQPLGEEHSPAARAVVVHPRPHLTQLLAGMQAKLQAALPEPEPEGQQQEGLAPR